MTSSANSSNKLPRRASRLRVALTLWVIAEVLLYLLRGILDDSLWVVVLVALALSAVVGLFILLTAVFSAWQSRHHKPLLRVFLGLSLATIVAAFALSLSTQYLVTIGGNAIVRIRFALHRSEYERIVQSTLARPADRKDSLSMFRNTAGISYRVSPGPPVRLAFPQPGEMAESWEGIVFDPTGEVLAARGSTFVGGVQDFTAPPRIRGLFGGDMVRCDHLEDRWYVCEFTYRT